MKSIYKRLKTAKKITLLFLVVIQLSACESFLETTPTDFLSPQNFYSSQPQLTAALLGVYSPLLNWETYGFAIPCLQECVTDEGFYNTAIIVSNNDVGLNTQAYTSYTPNLFWKQCYTGIERANQLIANIGNAQNVDTTFIKAVKSEAKFLRGYYHFMLVQNFGDVPLKISPTTDATVTNIARTPAAEVYKQILQDMTEAEAGLPTYQSDIYAGSTSRITKTAAEGILARVCLYMAGYPINDNSKYAAALTWAQKVKDSGIHSLYTMADTVANVINLRGMKLAYPTTNGNPAYKNNGYAQLFLNMTTNKYSPRESMWEIDASIVSSTSYAYNTYLGTQVGIAIYGNDPILGTCSPYINVHQYLFNLYATGDLRRDWAIAPYTISYTAATNTSARSFYTANQSLNRSVGKWRREYEPLGAGLTTKPKWNSQINFPVIRYADVLLMLCEAEFKINGATPIALDAINQVRRRAFGASTQADITTPNASVDLTAATLTLDEIQKERARELCFEGVRKADLIRWGIYMQRMQDIITNVNSVGQPSGWRSNALMSPQNTINAGPKVLLWPIPSSEVLVNTAITQNPGY
ncbi:MAG: RagB/SusD family nutrient uptake outer membrane protein [Bacteroidota bacterium]|nr:RagB/SusD family nutrient uptake outer membrane protein [Bacteroidota bacterium]